MKGAINNHRKILKSGIDKETEINGVCGCKIPLIIVNRRFQIDGVDEKYSKS